MTELTVDELYARIRDLEMVYKSNQERLVVDEKVIDSLRQKVKALERNLQATKAKLSVADGMLNWPPNSETGLTATREQVNAAIKVAVRKNYGYGAITAQACEALALHVDELLFPSAVPVDDEGVVITGSGFDTVILVDHKEFCRTHSTDNAVEIRDALKAARKTEK